MLKIKKFNPRRLNILKDYLRENVNPKQFDMFAVWEKNTETCGTAGCAMGWACSIPSFKRAGLKLKSMNYFDIDDVEIYDIEFKDLGCFEAASEFFTISKEEADYLFDPDSYPHTCKLTPKIVARRIENFINKKLKAQ